MYLLSLVIPVYNAELYLEDTLASIINQSIGFSNIELILVDDLSTDSSKKIIEKYVKKYDNVRAYFSDKNHGYPGFGRNVGLKNATADYVMFMDNDDELNVDMCKKLYETIVNENADVVCCDTHIVDLYGEEKNNIPYSNGIEKENFVIIEGDNLLLFKNNSVWNKIYKKTIIDENSIEFMENTYADDLVFTSTFFIKSKKLIYLKNYFGYKWKIRTDSLSHEVKKEHILELVSTYRHLKNIFEEENKLDMGKEVLRNHVGFLLLQCSYLNENKNETKKY